MAYLETHKFVLRKKIVKARKRAREERLAEDKDQNLNSDSEPEKETKSKKEEL